MNATDKKSITESLRERFNKFQDTFYLASRVTSRQKAILGSSRIDFNVCVIILLHNGLIARNEPT